jgi:hypothetical protein
MLSGSGCSGGAGPPRTVASIRSAALRAPKSTRTAALCLTVSTKSASRTAAHTCAGSPSTTRCSTRVASYGHQLLDQHPLGGHRRGASAVEQIVLERVAH